MAELRTARLQISLLVLLAFDVAWRLSWDFQWLQWVAHTAGRHFCGGGNA